MFTPEEIFHKNMFDMSMMVIPRKFTSRYNKLYPYTNLVPGHIPQFDSFDPHFLTESYNWIKNNPNVQRLELGLGVITANGADIIERDDVTNSYTFKMNGSLADVNGDATFTIPDSGDPNNPDGFWMILEFTPQADNPDIIISSNVGNYQMDIAGGTSRKWDKTQYDIMDGNHPVIIPMRVFSPDIGWVPVDHFGITIKGAKENDIVKVNNIRMYKVEYV